MSELFQRNHKANPLARYIASFDLDQRKNETVQQSDSLFTLCELQVSGVVAPKIPPCINRIHNEYNDLSMREILDISQELLLSGDEISNETRSMRLELNAFPVPRAPSSAEQDFKCCPMDEISNMTNTLEDIPVAADLVSSIDFSCPDKKRVRDDLTEDQDIFDRDDQNEDNRFRSYQTAQWSDKFDELCQYRKEHGHCLVPHTFTQNLPLARWVKRQRYQYKLMQEGRVSSMTLDRVKLLEDIGFVWDFQGVTWGERLGELRHYCNIFGNCNVPSNYPENPQLATWVKCQRRQYKLYTEGKPSNMSAQRIMEMNLLGFAWELRSANKKQRLQ